MMLAGRFYSLMLTFCFLLSGIVFADTYYVRQGGDDKADGKKPATAFATLQRAAQAVKSDDSIVIGPGLFRTSAVITDRISKKKLAIIGDENGKLTGDKAGAVILSPTLASDAALTFSKCTNVQVSGLTFKGPGQGIKLEKCGNINITRSTFDGLSRGVAADDVKGLLVSATVLTRNTLGIFVKSSNNVVIRHISAAGSTTAGIIVLQCGLGSIENSLFANNNSNYVVDDISAPAWRSDYNVLTGITGPWGAVPTVANVYEWSAASGQDQHSLYVMPAFVNAKEYDLHISPGITWPGGLPGMNVGLAAALAEIDRDGKPLRNRKSSASVGAYDYPDAVPAAGWKKLSYAMPVNNKRQSAGVYKTDGTLIRTLLADACGVRELWWDGLDDMGQPATAGAYEVRSITHNIRMLDDGAICDNGNPKGAYNCDNADRVVVLPDGGFAITAVYDEAGFTLRRYNSANQSIFASALVDGDFWGLAVQGNDIIGGRGKGKDAQLVKIIMPGERAQMATGAEYYSIFAKDESGTPVGVAVKGSTAFVSIGGLNAVRVIELNTGLKTTDWPITAVGDIACDAQGVIWVVSGTDVVSLTADGKINKRIATGLNAVNYLTAGNGKLAVNDRVNCQVAVIDIKAGKVVKTFGKKRDEYWMPVKPDVLRDPRGMAMYPDGRLILTEHARVRILQPDKMDTSIDLVSNFMETAVTHPTKPEYVYCGLGIYKINEKAGTWQWIYETPVAPYFVGKDNDLWAGKRIGSPGLSVVLGGRPFIGYYNGNGKGSLKLFDVTDPLKPRLALDYDNKDNALGGWAYDTICFTKDSSIVYGQSYTLSFKIIKFTGLDKDNNPSFNFAHPARIGNASEKSTRNMKSINAVTSDLGTGDIYFLAVTDQFKKMVPGWGADGTGVGRVSADAAPKWFARSSGGNYMSISSVNDGKRAWVMAAKSFGGQVDLFDPDGLRITTGNWSLPSGYSIGFVDMRYGIHSYLRGDGKPGAYVEDDAIGRFARCRMDGAETLKKVVTPFNWDTTAVAAGNMPQVDKTAGESLEKMQTVPKVQPFIVNGDWAQWEKAGVAPQIIGLPCNVGFKRTMADGLMQSFREGTMIGALAHDGANFYIYFVAADNTPLFEATSPVNLWQFDGIELWIEEEQFGLSLLKDGTPGLYKWRFHDRVGTEWKANYSLPKENVWGEKIADLSANKLGQRLEAITGTSFAGKPGFAVMGKIPFEEVKLVGGIAGREGKVLPMTGQPGEIVRFAVSLNNISLRGRCQDYMIDWPAGRMYADPTRSYPFRMN